MSSDAPLDPEIPSPPAGATTLTPDGPRRRPGARHIGVLIAIVAVAGWLWLAVLEPEHHRDGAGALTAGGAEIGESVPGDGPTSFGIDICLRPGSAPATIESIAPAAVRGVGPTLVGASYLFVDFAADPAHPAQGVGSVRGYPPENVRAGDLVDAVGATVTQTCVDQYPTYLSELVVGIALPPGSTGGWHGVDVRYRSGWRVRTVTLNYRFYLCGDDTGACLDEIDP